MNYIFACMLFCFTLTASSQDNSNLNFTLQNSITTKQNPKESPRKFTNSPVKNVTLVNTSRQLTATSISPNTKKMKSLLLSSNGEAPISSKQKSIQDLNVYIRNTEMLIDKLKSQNSKDQDKRIQKSEAALENAKIKLAFYNNQ